MWCQLGERADRFACKRRSISVRRLAYLPHRLDEQKTNEEVHTLGVLVLETFAMLEEGRTQELRNRDPRFAGLLRGRALDPGTAQRLAEVRRLRQYLEAQLAEVHARLDLDWQEHLARRKNRWVLAFPCAQCPLRAHVIFVIVGGTSITTTNVVFEYHSPNGAIAAGRDQGQTVYENKQYR